MLTTLLLEGRSYFNLLNSTNSRFLLIAYRLELLYQPKFDSNWICERRFDSSRGEGGTEKYDTTEDFQRQFRDPLVLEYMAEGRKFHSLSELKDFQVHSDLTMKLIL